MERQGLPTPRRGGAGGGVKQHADTQNGILTPPLNPLPFASEWAGSRLSRITGMGNLIRFIYRRQDFEARGEGATHVLLAAFATRQFVANMVKK